MIQTHQFTIGWRIYKSRRKLNRVSQNLQQNRTGLNAQQLFASNSAFAAITDEVIFFFRMDISGVGGNAVPMPFSVYMDVSSKKRGKTPKWPIFSVFFLYEDVEPKIGVYTIPQNGWFEKLMETSIKNG